MGSGFSRRVHPQCSLFAPIADYRKVWPFPTESLAISTNRFISYRSFC